MHGTGSDRSSLSARIGCISAPMRPLRCRMPILAVPDGDLSDEHGFALYTEWNMCCVVSIDVIYVYKQQDSTVALMGSVRDQVDVVVYLRFESHREVGYAE